MIDLIIEILRGSRDQKMAKACLINGETEGIKFKSKASEAMAAQLCFTEPQAAAILEMRLYKLIGLEIEALIKEHAGNQGKDCRVQRYFRASIIHGKGHYEGA